MNIVDDNKKNQPCPCGSGSLAENCCLPLVNGDDVAQKPEQLMRSRYCAFVWGCGVYLFDTCHPTKRRDSTLQEIEDTIESTEWHSLKVLAASKDGAQDAYVEFVAFYSNRSDAGPRSLALQLHEQSHFVRENQRWYYTGGDILKPQALGRNDLCWCGSGKKYKKCHA